ncbi:hypothetical protein KSP39_PZI015562 [Platanthera zijinensis]|uniref:Uncharacterized protein n=1 Tax=Platanthera zijinensis TaxID=2320716 RepID=A0AAP0G1J0_9ASPA
MNYEKHQSMCYSLRVDVLPFLRRGSHGHLCSFSCTIATPKKFKNALAKHSIGRCCLGPAKGLEEPDLLALAAKKFLLLLLQEASVGRNFSTNYEALLYGLSKLKSG